jgi:hypothetical protein
MDETSSLAFPMIRTSSRAASWHVPPMAADVRTILDGILDNAEALETVSARSYQHQLGFFKYVLQEHASGECLRLHVWESGRMLAEDIHSHCSTFHSRVLAGSIEENQYSLTEGSTFNMFAYTRQSGDQICARFVGTADAHLLDSRKLSPGDAYIRMHAQLHNISAVAPNTVTVSRWQRRQFDALVLKHRAAIASDCERGNSLNVRSVAAKLNSLRELLAET